MGSDYWIPKYGAVEMHPVNISNADYALAVRNFEFFLPFALWEDAAVLWYAPFYDDDIEITVGLTNPGSGKTTIVVASNYSMSRYVGIMFDTTPATDTVQAVYGTGPLTMTGKGSSANHTISSDGGMYTIRFTKSTKKLQLYQQGNGTAILEWTDSDGLMPRGEGYRYAGASWQASFLSVGPQIYYWKMGEPA